MYSNGLRSIALFVLFLMFIPAAACRKRAKEPVVSSAQPEQNQIETRSADPKAIIVSSVNGSSITMAALIREMNLIAGRYYKPGQAASANVDEKIKREALDHLIFKELGIQEALRQGMAVKPERIGEVIKQMKAGFGSVQAFQNYLGGRGLTEEQLRKEIERSHLFEMISAREVYDSLTVDEKTLRQTYEQQKNRFMTRDNPPQLRSFEEVKDFLKREAKAELGAKKMKEWEKKLRGKAVIHITLYNENSNKAADAPRDRRKS